MSLRKKNLLVAREPGKYTRSQGKGDFDVFGYYDELAIQKIKCLAEFSPLRRKLTVINEEYRMPYTNYFSIRLVDIDPDIYAKGMNCIPSCLIEDEGTKLTFEKLPLLSIIVLNFSHTAIKTKTFGENVGDITEIVKKTHQVPACGQPNLYKLYYCLGIPNVVMLCRSNNYSSIFELLYNLRARLDLVSASYMIPCISRQYKPGLWDMDRDKDIRLSLRALLKPGTTVNALMNKLRQSLEDSGDTEDSLTCFHIAGFSEFIALINSRAYLGSCLRQPDEPLFFGGLSDELVGLRSSIMMLPSAGCEKNVMDKSEESKFEEIKEAYKNAFEERLKENEKTIAALSKTLEKHTNALAGKERRIFEGIIQMVNFYFDLSELDYHYDVRFMFDDVFKTFLSIFSYYDKNLTLPPSVNQTTEEQQIEKRKRMKLASVVDKDLNSFRQFISTIINDINRSSRLWLEGRFLVHQIIGTSQKLLFAYTALVRKVVAYLEDKGKSHGHCCFIVSSGGTDTIEAKRFFRTLNDDKDQRNKIIALTLPEKTLFSLPMFAIFHEVFHFVGDRLREKREKCFLLTLSYRYSFFIADKLMDEHIKPYILGSKGYNRELKESEMDEYCMRRKLFCEKIKELFHKRINDADLSGKLKYFSHEDAINELNTVLKIIMTPDDIDFWRDQRKTSNSPRGKSSEFVKDVAKVFTWLWKNYGNSIYNKLYKGSKPENWGAGIEKICKSYHKDEHYSSNLNLVRRFFDGYLHLFLYGQNYMEKKPEDIRKETMNVYKETFADVCSLVLLQYDLRSYLKLKYAERNTHKIMPENEIGRARFFSSLRVLFFKDDKKQAAAFCRQEGDKSRQQETGYEIFNKMIANTIGAFIDDKKAAKDYVGFLYDQYAEHAQQLEVYASLEEYLKECVKELRAVLKNAPFNSDLRALCRNPEDEKIMETIVSLLREFS